MKIELDLSKLQQNRRDKSRWQCPACAEAGGDKNREHLKVTDNWWGCAKFPGDREHSRRIIELAGITPDRPADPQEIARRAAEDQARKAATARMEQLRKETARRAMNAILCNFQWDKADVWEDSPLRIETPPTPQEFLDRMFQPQDVVWCGNLGDSGKPEHARHWQPVSEWVKTSGNLGEQTHPAIWKPGVFARSGGNIVSKPWVVLEIDKHPITGIEPDPRDLAAVEELHAVSLAVCRWLREKCQWELGAILDTGGKSLHCWFRHPANLAKITPSLGALGLDTSMLSQNHTSRLPSILRDTGRKSEIIWLK